MNILWPEVRLQNTPLLYVPIFSFSHKKEDRVQNKIALKSVCLVILGILLILSLEEISSEDLNLF